VSGMNRQWNRRARWARTGEGGIALVTTLLVALAVTSIIVGAIMIGSNAQLINRYRSRYSSLDAVADAGLDRARALINGDRALYPDTGYVALESEASVSDAGGSVIPNVRRSLYVGPSGVTSGQYGVYGSIVSVAEDVFGNRTVRRELVYQESFAKYAYFTDIEPASIAFGGGDAIYGPVHTNDLLKIYSSGASFYSTVTTAKTVQGAQYGVFKQGYTENVAKVPMPQTAELTKLQTQATAGNTSFVGTTSGGSGEATTRIEFVAIDLNGDGDATDDNEGFFRIYQSSNAGWVVGARPSDFSSNRLRNSRHCGHYHADGTFRTASNHPSSGSDNKSNAVTTGVRRCFLGGSDSLFGGFQVTDSLGRWLPWPGPVSPLLAGRPDAGYLFPLSRALNPSFKGVIYVTGKVAISGTVRGRVTLAASGNIVIADDVQYATGSGSGSCRDILGLFSGQDIIVADNTLNSPIQAVPSGTYATFDVTKDEFVSAVILALNIFSVENYSSGHTTAEPCESTAWGRGCLYLTGGIIQKTRGAVGTIGSPGGTGYLKRYSYDQCAFSDPPPYYPTTGHFVRGQWYEVDPAGFDVGQYFALLAQ